MYKKWNFAYFFCAKVLFFSHLIFSFGTLLIFLQLLLIDYNIILPPLDFINILKMGSIWQEGTTLLHASARRLRVTRRANNVMDDMNKICAFVATRAAMKRTR